MISIKARVRFGDHDQERVHTLANRSCALVLRSLTYLAYARTRLQPMFSVSWALVKDGGLCKQKISKMVWFEINSFKMSAYFHHFSWSKCICWEYCLQKNNNIWIDVKYCGLGCDRNCFSAGPQTRSCSLVFGQTKRLAKTHP